MAEGKARPIAGLSIDDEPIRWSGDGRSIYVRQREQETTRMRVYRLDLVTGRREMWKEYEPDPSQTAGGIPLALTPDGRWLLFTQLDQYGKDILLVENFR